MKILYLIIGFVSLSLGVLFIPLPLFPTTPFLLIASICFAKGSEKFNNWFINSNIYKNNLKSFVDKREMKLKTKVFLMLFSSSMICISIFMVDIIYLKIFLILLDIIKYYYFIFKIKTI